MKFSGYIYDVLISSGWYPGRQVTDKVEYWTRQLVDNGGFVMHTHAKDILLEFGGLRIKRKTIHKPESLIADLTPILAQGDEDRFDYYSGVVNDALFPLGEVYHCGYVFLAIGKSGKTFYVMEDIWPAGDNFIQTLELLIGKRPVK